MAETEDDGPQEGSTGMEPGQMKAALARARSAPLNCGVAVGDPKGGSLGLIMMSKTKNGKGLVKELKEQYPDLRTPCFGTVSVDGDTKQVKFQLNKRPPGLDKRLRKTLKPIGFGKIEIEIGSGGDEDADQ